MKKILYYTIGVASLALLLIVTSCVNDPTSDSSSGVNDPNAFLTVEEAQGFFEESFADATRSGNIDLEQELFSAGDYTPLWGEARTSENEGQGSVDVPIIAGKKYRAIRSEFHHGHAHAYMVEMTQKLIVVKNKETNSTSQFLLTLIPDKDYYAKNKGDISDKFLSSGNKGEFSGYALYTYNGFAVRLNKYSRGKIIGGVTVLGVTEETEFENRLAAIYGELDKMQFQSQSQSVMTRSGVEDGDVWEVYEYEDRYEVYHYYDGELQSVYIYEKYDMILCKYCQEYFCEEACQTCYIEGCDIPWCNGNCQTCPENCGIVGCVGECQVSSEIELCDNNRCAASNCMCCTKGCVGECKAKCLYGDKCHVIGSCICCYICKDICKIGCTNQGKCHYNSSGKCTCP